MNAPAVTHPAPSKAPPPSPLGPVSSALEAELRSRVVTQGLVVWLDQADHYSGFIDQLAAARAAGELPYEVRAFRGSYLELITGLADLTGGSELPRLVVHLPGFNEESVRQTPMLELYLAGVRFRKGLDTLVTEAASQRVRPEEIAAFAGAADLTLEGADAWLRAALDGQEAGLAAQLRAISPGALLDDLLSPPSRPGYVAGRVDVAADAEVIFAHLEVTLGLPQRWREEKLGAASGESSRALRPESVAHAAASWALAVEYVDDLKRAPVAPRLVGIDQRPAGVREACSALAAHLRDRHPEFYRRTADDTEASLSEEVSAARAEDLGRIDTFRFEEDRVLEAAVGALAARDYALALEYADVRVHGDSFWLRGDLSRGSAWKLVSAAATLGQAIGAAGERLAPAGQAVVDHAAAVARYTEAGAGVDHAHRHLEQLRLKLLSPQLPRFEDLRARLDAMRAEWRAWADAWAADYSALCVREGFLPPSDLQQRELFEQVVRPLVNEGQKTAYFVIDAFRYEMGAELGRALDAAVKGAKHTHVHLGARLAELPTNTEIGMNVLAPVADQGRLRPAIRNGKVAGFDSGEFRVTNPETRRRAMHARVSGQTCPWLPLAEVVARDAASLKNTVAQAKLLVVHSEEIDKAGEKGVGPAMFDAVMQQIRSAWQLLREAGVRRFVFTADHGFLLLDARTTTAQPHGRKIDPNRRHVLTTKGADRKDEVRVSLSSLHYEDPDGHDLIFPTTTAPFDTGKRRRTFVHGGNSLQERVIPVLTVSHQKSAGGNTARYRVEAEARQGVGDLHCLRATVVMETQQGTLDFGGVSEVELGLRAAELPDVTVELVEARDGARLTRGELIAPVGRAFEVFFKLLGDTDARARVVLHHPTRRVEIAEGGPAQRYAVAVLVPANRDDGDAERPPEAAAPAAATVAAPASVAPPATNWLEELPEGGVRDVFAHIEAHGVCREDEASQKLGGGRAQRRFARMFDEYAKLAPFETVVESHGGVKRYVKKGSS